jgi:hypothetical protein
MQLTDKQIKEFQALYHKQHGIEISFEKARELGTKLVQLVALVYKPIRKQNSSENTGEIL